MTVAFCHKVAKRNNRNKIHIRFIMGVNIKQFYSASAVFPPEINDILSHHIIFSMKIKPLNENETQHVS